MSIELLWILPVIGFGTFVFLVVFLIQKSYSNSSDQDLKNQVKQFNMGAHHAASGQERPVKELENRISELESAITYMTKSISLQQKSLDQFALDEQGQTDEATVLKRKLADLHREYDVVLSENYSLRSRLRKLLKEQEGDSKESQNKVNLRLFEDTRFLNPSNLDDTTEIDLSKLG
ncbi:MAG: hypothetical protein ACLFQB_04835 [Chitinispirillaceae bacterium]